MGRGTRGEGRGTVDANIDLKPRIFGPEIWNRGLGTLNLEFGIWNLSERYN